MSTVIQLKRGTSADWELYNPVLAEAEVGYDITNKKIKIGDGTSTWTQLSYQGSDPGTLAKRHTQSSQQSVWTITHALGFSPNVTATDINGNIIEGDIDYVDSVTITITFSEAYSGYAYLS